MRVSNSKLSPDKPGNTIFVVLRYLIREIRWFFLGLKNFGKIRRGANCYFGRNSEFYIPDQISFGSNISIGSNFITQVNLDVGDDCLISSRVSFIGNDHDLFDPDKTAYFSGRVQSSEIKLEGNNFVGFGATLLGSITIGYGSVIAAGSLVRSDVPAGVIVAGIPARVIGYRDIKKRDSK